MVRRTHTAEGLRRLLQGDPSFLLVSQSQYYAKETVKYLIGNTAYHKIWLALARSGETH
jgi:hypothetical protein